jgi:hypothetical protein
MTLRWDWKILNSSYNWAAATFHTVPGAVKPTSDKPYASVTIKTTPEEDATIRTAIQLEINEPPRARPNYNLLQNNAQTRWKNCSVREG